jgi:hypothetical protein
MGKPPSGFEVARELGFGGRITDWNLIISRSFYR